MHHEHPAGLLLELLDPGALDVFHGLGRLLDAFFDGIVEALDRNGIRTDLKWPNDVLLGDGKLAGVLIEVTEDLAESCNGEDDDCDGETDEDWPELGTACDGPDADALREAARFVIAREL